MEKTWLYALVAGIFPAIFWIIFWMREDDDDMPEPRTLIIETFIFGGLIGFVASGTETLINYLDIVKYETIAGIILFAFIEEFLKFFIVYKTALQTRFNNERMDPVLYMIVGGLGFAAMENIFYLIDYIHNFEYIKSMIDGGYRFIGSTLLHTISSAFIGIGCAVFYFKKWNIKIVAVLIGLIIATIMHSLFNFLVMSGNDLYKDIAFYGSWSSIVILLVIFEILRRETRIRPRSDIRKKNGKFKK